MNYLELLESETLDEEAVLSSWIDDLTYDPSQQAVIMSLLSGRSYTVYDMDEDNFDSWVRAPSQGRYWHEYIRDFHQVF